MASDAYAKRHAQEVFDIALEKKELNKWQSELRRIASLVRDEALLALLENPKVSFDNKAKVLSERLGGISTDALKLVSELMAKSRLAVIVDIADEYQRLLDNYRGIEGAEVAEVTTAIPLDDADRLRIAQRITSIIGKPVVLEPKVDSSMIGGLIIRVGDKLIDGSIRSKLEALRREIGKSTK